MSLKSFRPCVLIPIYDQPDHITQTITELAALKLDCIIVDDGSKQETIVLLKDLESTFSQFLKVIYKPINEGKGAALTSGFQQALNDGYTHAIQIDADGQHRTDDIPRFIDAARNHPNSLISGAPIYDESAPLARLLGRQMSRLLCWAQTHSFALADPLLGFRLYPLEEVDHLLSYHTLKCRMDFDLDIGVRLIWQGLDVVNIPTKVAYHEDGVSHFNYLKDNLRLARLHIELLLLSFLLMIGIYKVPSKSTQQRKGWSERQERGCKLGLKIVFFIYRILGRKLSAILLYPVSLYFFITGRTARQASLDFQEILRNKRSLLWSFQHFHEFSIQTVDKVAAWLGDIQKDELDFENYEVLKSIRFGGEGIIFLGSHLGNIETCRAISEMHPDVKINALMMTEHAAQFHEFLNEVCGSEKLRAVKLDQPSGSLVAELEQRLDAGEHVAILGDRVPPNSQNKVVPVDFLGRSAQFPQGPMLLASLLKRPVYLLFCLRKPDYGFKVYVEKFADSIEIPRRTRMASLTEWTQKFATRLEHYVQLAPKQWFNFYAFWDDSESAHSTSQVTKSSIQSERSPEYLHRKNQDQAEKERSARG